MEIKKRFPIWGFADVIEDVKVKYRFPTVGQVRLMGDESNTHGYAMAVCKYCVEDIQGLASEGQPIPVEREKDGTLSDDFVLMLYTNGLAFPIAGYYQKNVGFTPTDKKKYSSSPTRSKRESKSPIKSGS
jgi:hypothetical protein